MDLPYTYFSLLLVPLQSNKAVSKVIFIVQNQKRLNVKIRTIILKGVVLNYQKNAGGEVANWLKLYRMRFNRST